MKKIAVIVALVLSGCASAPDDCGADRYNPPSIVSLNRPVSVLVVDAMPDQAGCRGNWACTANAFGQGRAIIYLRRDKQACLFHELAHAGGWNHEK